MVFIELLKIILPALLVLGAVFYLVHRFLDSEQKRRELELKKNTQTSVLPLKIQAYERLIIFLERIQPNSIVLRVNKNGMSAHQLQLELIKTIKSEYEHNLSQQIYLSAGAWELIKNAKEEIIKLINISSTKVPYENNSNELAMMILNVAANLDKKLPTDIAIEYIKKEVSYIL